MLNAALAIDLFNTISLQVRVLLSLSLMVYQTPKAPITKANNPAQMFELYVS